MQIVIFKYYVGNKRKFIKMQNQIYLGTDNTKKNVIGCTINCLNDISRIEIDESKKVYKDFCNKHIAELTLLDENINLFNKKYKKADILTKKSLVDQYLIRIHASVIPYIKRILVDFKLERNTYIESLDKVQDYQPIFLDKDQDHQPIFGGIGDKNDINKLKEKYNIFNIVGLTNSLDFINSKEKCYMFFDELIKTYEIKNYYDLYADKEKYIFTISVLLIINIYPKEQHTINYLIEFLSKIIDSTGLYSLLSDLRQNKHSEICYLLYKDLSTYFIVLEKHYPLCLLPIISRLQEYLQKKKYHIIK